MEVLLKALLIFVARIADVSLGTMRTVAVINGHRYLALGLGFVEVLIWILAVSAVVGSALSEPIYAVAYAGGFAAGNFVGITIESKIAFGAEVMRVFTRKGAEVSAALREAGYRVTQFEGSGRDGPISLLFIKVERRKIRGVAQLARKSDPDCFYITEPIRSASVPSTLQPPAGWRSALIRK